MHISFVIRPLVPPRSLLPVVSSIASALNALSTLQDTTSRHLYTLFLFTYTDYKTIFLPITLFSCIAAPVHSPTHFIKGIIWIWLHLLQCNVSNQYKSSIEDAVNRPWRPLPSGRVTLAEATVLRWVLVALCAGISSFFGSDVLLVSVALTLTMVVYDELGLAAHWLGKNVCNISGYVTFELGATKIMGQSSTLDFTALLSVLMSASIIFTTIQMQDFPDTLGDRALGRKTIPIQFPRASRVFTSICMICWSLVLSNVWHLGPLKATAMCLLGAIIAYRVYALRETQDDKRTYLIYNIWLATAHCLPANVR